MAGSLGKNLRQESDSVGMADIVSFQIRLAQSAVYRRFIETFQHLNLTQKQLGILWLVDDHPDISQSNLSRLMRMDRATTMAIVNRIERRGYLTRSSVKTDKRKKALNLTDEGRAVLARAKAAMREHEDWLTSRFSEEEVCQFVKLLSRIHE